MKKRFDVLVIGAGVIGLTTGIRLIEAGLSACIVADQQPHETTSANSGAIWGPFLSELDMRVLDWSFRTFEVLRELSAAPWSG
ncbi:MAG: FAD-dependent oxidoreductase, partial [bacterium]